MLGVGHESAGGRDEDRRAHAVLVKHAPRDRYRVACLRLGDHELVEGWLVPRAQRLGKPPAGPWLAYAASQLVVVDEREDGRVDDHAPPAASSGVA